MNNEVYQKMPLTKRLDANLGYFCNNNCLFCYFMDRNKGSCNLDTGKAIKLFSFIRKLGIDTLEITGGEATLRDDILDLILYAKKKLQFKKISIITNGTMFSDERFAAQAVEAVVDDVLVSIHGHDAALHDRLAGRNGAFQEVLKAVKNIKQLNISCRSNTVINSLNYKKSTEIAGLLHDLGIEKINYIFFSPLDDAIKANHELWLRYSIAAPFIKQMIEDYGLKIKTISIKVIPFCQLEGYERYITDFFQNIYDPYEWDYFNRVRVRRGAVIALSAALFGTLFLMPAKRVASLSLRGSLYEGIMHTQASRENTKGSLCKTCKFDLICPGVWKEYARIFGLKELKPVEGGKINDPDYYLRYRFSDYYKT